MASSITMRDVEEDTGKEMKLVSLVTFLVVICLAAIAFCASMIIRRRRARYYREALKANPHIIQVRGAPWQEWSDLERMDEVELQRKTMISKSLASRNSSWSTITSGDAKRKEEDDSDEEQSDGLKHNWKEWEASIKRDRSASIEKHPGFDHAFSGPCDLPMPAPAQAESPPRHPLLVNNARMSLPSASRKPSSKRELLEWKRKSKA
ncbi:hypothetical protein G7046_g1925 [Stylonectria norvegica]|nr:hypothetical protein G7046_g1925 [Stylonectria norvegica]